MPTIQIAEQSAPKIKTSKQALVILLISGLAGCATTIGPNDQSEPVAVEVEDRVIVDGKALPLPEQPSFQVETLDEPVRASPVVSKLMASAQRQRRANQWDAANSSMERALRIEPRNAQLWSTLAEIKFDQKDWRGAIQVAAKSNTLSGSNEQLRRRNWYLMANAYEALGNNEAAARFRAKLI